MPLDPDIPHQDITYKIIGAAMRVHNRVKPGLRERHYQRDLTAEMREAGLKVSEKHHIELYDGDRWLGRLYLDHLVEDCVVVEVKAFSHMLTNEEVAQVICYLAATGLKVGLLLNFGRSAWNTDASCRPGSSTVGKSVFGVICGSRKIHRRAADSLSTDR